VENFGLGFSHTSLFTKKPNETRMGSGKSPVDHYAAVVKPGKIIFEMSGVTEDVARAAFRRAADKIPMKTRFINAEDQI